MAAYIPSTLAPAGSVVMTACADDSEATASLQHDLGGSRTLHSYAPEPAEETRQGDRVHEQLYGIRTQSPKTPYICVWRDTGRGTVRDSGGDGPSEVFLTCSFSTSAWMPSPSLAEEAAERVRRDETVLRVQWVRENDGYRMTRFEVEIHNAGSETWFRSSNFDEGLSDIDFRQAEIGFPASAGQPMDFQISALVPGIPGTLYLFLILRFPDGFRDSGMGGMLGNDKAGDT